MDDLDPQAPWTSLTYAVVDVEGNGQQPPDLVELAIVPISDGQIADPITWLVRPPRPILPMARRFHHISDADVTSSPSVIECADWMRRSLDGAVFVAHNAQIDLGVLTRELPGFAPTHVIDTVKLARRLLPGLDSYKLGALVDALDLAKGLPDDLAPHRATYDALVCARLLTRLAAPPEARPRSVGDLFDQPERRKSGGGTGDDSATALF